MPRVNKPQAAPPPGSPTVESAHSRTCDFCEAELVSEYFDAKTIFGPWANMCRRCFREKGPKSLGLGVGQQFQAGPEGYWKKVAG